MTDYLTGGLALLALYWLPGWIFLRRSELDLPTRSVAAVVVSYAAVTGITELLGASGVLTRWSLLLAVAALVGLAVGFPIRAVAFASRNDSGLALPLAVAALFGALVLAQAVRPAIVRTNDALATWAPLTVDIAESGDLAPDSLQTLLEGFPPSVALMAGSASLLVGGFAEAHMFLVHPAFTTLLLMTVVLLGGWMGGRRAAWIALIAVLATPLLKRSVVFHDDFVVSFFATVAVLLALRARNTPGWVIAGAAAGSALAVKHLGLVALLLVGVVLIARRPATAGWVGAAGGWLVGLPWYIWNVIRFGNPIYPLLPERFGESAGVIRIVSDHNANRLAGDRGSIWALGILTLALVAVGVAAAVWRAVRDRDRYMQTYASALIIASALFLIVWNASGYATRHMMIIVPVLAALAGYGLSSPGRAGSSGSDRPSLVAAAGFLALGAFTVASVGAAFYQDEVPPEAVQTGPFVVLEGKMRDVRLLAEPPEDPLGLFGPIRLVWEQLRAEDSSRLVLSFDNRSYLIPQRILSATDLAALPIYDAPDSAARHRALVESGVGFVFDNRGRSVNHPLYAESFWRELDDHPDFYEPIVSFSRFVLYEVVEAPIG